MKAEIFNYKDWVENTDPYSLFKEFKHLLEYSNFQILGTVDHHFEPYGYTALFLLGESHLAIHTFDEEDKTYIELSSCNKEYYDRFIYYYKNTTKANLEKIGLNE